MSSQPNELFINKEKLQRHRQAVDTQINQTISVLKQNGFQSIAGHLQTDLKVKLAQARRVVDVYIETPYSQRSSQQLIMQF
jgi:hypothetical protein